MGLLPWQRNSRQSTNAQECFVENNYGSLVNKKKWSNWILIFVALVVIGEIAFLARLDTTKTIDSVSNSFSDAFDSSSELLPLRPWITSTSTTISISSDVEEGVAAEADASIDDGESCEEWLVRVDAVKYSRDFKENPIRVSGAEQEWKSCAVGCKFGFDSNGKPDAGFGMPQQAGTASVLRSMESSQYYSENNLAQARRSGYDIVMTTSLSSDVPVGYFSWAEYDIMAPVQPKTESALAAAFISNCGARNFRLQGLEGLEKEKIKIDSYGSCHRNRDGRVDKVQALKRYKFSLAFENSNEEDYVTEKFFQSLVAGTIPVVIGAPNIEDFAPSPSSILHIKGLKDVPSVAKTMKHLAENPDAYNQSLRWKYEGPSDSFKALVDMAAVHSSCRLCIHLATALREKEEKSLEYSKRPCKCTRGSETVYHLYVRERGRFDMESVFLRSGSLTLEALESAVLAKFKSLQHVPIWKPERPESIRGGNELKVYRIYPLGMTQRQALYTFRFNSNAAFRSHLESNPCAKFEVIFV
ncbi:Glycosyl transferase family 10 [Dillenia turbinata]|uniref:Fucosyltransferase n=1 Tax=Dillenia turbinata TaxID=194707 RepID=A0AAN8ZQ96_9MAGN